MPLMRYDIPDGEGNFKVRYWSARNRPVLSPAGEVLFLLHSTEYVTAAVLAQQKMQESEERFRTLVEQAPVAIGLTRGPDLIFESINASMLPIIGREHPGEVIGKALVEILPEIQEQPVLELIRRVYQTGESFQGLGIPAALRVGGQLRQRYYNVSYTPLREDGQITGVIHLAVEVTEQVEARKQLEQSQGPSPWLRNWPRPMRNYGLPTRRSNLLMRNWLTPTSSSPVPTRNLTSTSTRSPTTSAP